MGLFNSFVEQYVSDKNLNHKFSLGDVVCSAKTAYVLSVSVCCMCESVMLNSKVIIDMDTNDVADVHIGEVSLNVYYITVASSERGKLKEIKTFRTGTTSQSAREAFKLLLKTKPHIDDVESILAYSGFPRENEFDNAYMTVARNYIRKTCSKYIELASYKKDSLSIERKAI